MWAGILKVSAMKFVVLFSVASLSIAVTACDTGPLTPSPAAPPLSSVGEASAVSRNSLPVFTVNIPARSAVCAGRAVTIFPSPNNILLLRAHREGVRDRGAAYLLNPECLTAECTGVRLATPASFQSVWAGGGLVFAADLDDRLHSFKLEINSEGVSISQHQIRSLPHGLGRRLVVVGRSPASDIDEEYDRLTAAAEAMVPAFLQEARIAEMDLLTITVSAAGFDGATFRDRETLEAWRLDAEAQLAATGQALPYGRMPVVIGTGQGRPPMLITMAGAPSSPELSQGAPWPIIDSETGHITGWFGEQHVQKTVGFADVAEFTVNQGNFSLLAHSRHDRGWAASLVAPDNSSRLVLRVDNDGAQAVTIECGPSEVLSAQTFGLASPWQQTGTEPGAPARFEVQELDLGQPGRPLPVRHYAVEDRRGVVAFFPGGPASSRNYHADFAAVRQYLGAGFDVLAVTHGGSDSADPRVSNRLRDEGFDGVIEDLERVNTHLGSIRRADEPIVLAAESYGASHFLALNEIDSSEFTQAILLAPWLLYRSFEDRGVDPGDPTELHFRQQREINMFGADYLTAPDGFVSVQEALLERCRFDGPVLAVFGQHDLIAQPEDLRGCRIPSLNVQMVDANHGQLPGHAQSVDIIEQFLDVVSPPEALPD